MAPPLRPWPGGKRFAFSICDDADHGTLANVGPIYRLLEELGLRTTKTVWVFPPDPSHGFGGDCLGDPPYLEFVKGLKAKGFGVALHGVRSGDSTRPQIEEGFRIYAEAFGGPPTLHVNHARNRDNIHWGDAWLPRWRRLLGQTTGRVFEGDREGTPYFWGDLCRRQIRYVRGRTFRGIDTLRADPFMPYHEERFPFVRAWFSSSDGEDGGRFARLISEENQEELEAGGGCCLVYTHFGTGFVDGAGRVDPEVERLLRRLAARPGWFAPVEEILDFLDGGALRTLSTGQRLRLSWNSRTDRWRNGTR